MDLLEELRYRTKKDEEVLLAYKNLTLNPKRVRAVLPDDPDRASLMEMDTIFSKPSESKVCGNEHPSSSSSSSREKKLLYIENRVSATRQYLQDKALAHKMG
jgi:hypothetical protein